MQNKKSLDELMIEIFKIYRMKLHELEAVYALAVYRSQGDNINKTHKLLGCSYRKAWMLINEEIQGEEHVRKERGN